MKKNVLRIAAPLAKIEQLITPIFWCPQKFPDWLCVGFQKAGTTWLSENLRCHSGVFIPEKKELHYFNRKLHRPLLWYLSQFKDALPDKKKGELTPLYAMLSEDVLNYIHRCNPNLRIILLLRNPIERIWSLAMMHLGHKQGRRSSDIPKAEVDTLFQRFPFSTYTDVVVRWKTIFGPENVLVAFYEQICREPEALLQQVFRHIGVGDDISLEDFPVREKIFVGDKSTIPEAIQCRIRDTLLSDMKELAKQYPNPVSTWMGAKREQCIPKEGETTGVT